MLPETVSFTLLVSPLTSEAGLETTSSSLPKAKLLPTIGGFERLIPTVRYEIDVEMTRSTAIKARTAKRSFFLEKEKLGFRGWALVANCLVPSAGTAGERPGSIPDINL